MGSAKKRSKWYCPAKRECRMADRHRIKYAFALSAPLLFCFIYFKRDNVGRAFFHAFSTPQTRDSHIGKLAFQAGIAANAAQQVNRKF